MSESPEELAAWFKSLGAGLEQNSQAAVMQGALFLVGAITALAPRDLGDYMRSWNAQPMTRGVGGGHRASAGTIAPQARRLEYGFYGMTDSLGRTFYQKPQPHVDPAILSSLATIEGIVFDALFGRSLG